MSRQNIQCDHTIMYYTTASEKVSVRKTREDFPTLKQFILESLLTFAHDHQRITI